jgi:hypothetical protein
MERRLDPRTVCTICVRIRATVSSELLTVEVILIVSRPDRLQKLARLARPNRVRMMQRDFPESWVHDSGRLVVVGSAAHPWPVRRSPPLLLWHSRLAQSLINAQ